MNRFSRQTILPEFGPAGQRALADSKVLIIGCGGLGSPVALYLSAAGVGKIGLVDADSVDLSNLQRQILFTEGAVGREKVAAAKERLGGVNSAVNVEAFSRLYSGEWALEISKNYDLLVDCTDNFSTKFLINDIAIKLNKPFVQASVTGFEGRLINFWPAKGPCLRCLYPRIPESKIQNCQESGVLGPVVGTVGCWQALECIKVMLDLHGSTDLRPIYGRMMVFDFLENSQQTLKLPEREGCVCRGAAERIRIGDVLSVCKNDSSIREISWNEACSLDSVAFLDVRELSELVEGMIPGAKHWPLSEIESGATPDFLEQNQNWVIYCAGGMRSRKVAALLKSRFFDLNMFSLSGGICALAPEVLCAPDDSVGDRR